MALVDAINIGTANQTVWLRWMYSQTTGTGSSITMSETANGVWANWNDITYSTTTTFTNFRDAVWGAWQQQPATPAPYRTPEEIQADADAAQARREEASRRELAARAARAEAEDRAMELLMALLTEEETRHFIEHDEIQVRSEHGNLYVIEKRGVHGNIRQVDEHGCLLGRICVAPRMRDEQQRTLPYADGWIGQYLMLKHDEDLIIGRGNWSFRKPCQHPQVPILAVAA